MSKLAHFSGHKGSIFSLAKGLRNHTFFSGADDGYVVEWNIESKGDGKLLVQLNKPIYTILVDETKQEILCGSASGNLHIINLEQRKEIRNIEAHKLGIFDIKKIGENFVTSGGDGNICVWDIDFNLTKTIKASAKSARIIAVNSSEKEMAVGFSDFYIRVYNTTTWEMVFNFLAHTNSVFALTYNPTDTILYSGGRDVMLKSWDIQQAFLEKFTIAAHNLHINAIAFSPSGELFASVSMDKTIKIWDATTNELLKVIDKPRNDGHTTSVNKIVWLSKNEFVTCSDDKTIMMWQIEMNLPAI